MLTGRALEYRTSKHPPDQDSWSGDPWGERMGIDQEFVVKT